MTVRLDEQVWQDVQRRRTPDRWVIVLALVWGLGLAAYRDTSPSRLTR